MKYQIIKRGIFTKEILGEFSTYSDATENWWERLKSQVENNREIWHSYRILAIETEFPIQVYLRRGIIDYLQVFYSKDVVI